MTQPERVTALDLEPEREVDPDNAAYFQKCLDKLGLVPNVLRAYAWNQRKLKNFIALYNELMLGESGLTKLEREMIAVAVSAANRCYYWEVAHGAAVRQLAQDPELGEALVLNYRVADLEPRQRAMRDFAVKLTEESHLIEADDRARLREVGRVVGAHRRLHRRGGADRPLAPQGRSPPRPRPHPRPRLAQVTRTAAPLAASRIKLTSGS